MYGAYGIYQKDYSIKKLYYENREITYDELNGKMIEEIIEGCLEKINVYIEKLENKYADDILVIKYKELFNDLNEVIINKLLPVLPDNNKKTKYFNNFIKNLCSDLCDYSNNFINDDLSYFISNNESNYKEILYLINKINNLDYIKIFSNIDDSNITIIGGNGSGKSSFVSLLKYLYNDSMVVVPAQKLLLFDNTINGVITSKEIDIKNMQSQNAIEDQRAQFAYISSSYSGTIFTKMVTAIVNTTIRQQDECYKNNKNDYKTILEKINDVCKKNINVTFKLNFDNYSLDVIDHKGNIYNINSASDGEKAILYYVGNILFANRNSYIVIDEPEIHLNPAVYKKIWDELENERNDCQFIYISHDIDFVISRKNSKWFWMNSFEHPGKWDIKPIEDSNEIPQELMIEIYGSKNKLLFCEGTKKSDDVKIYSSIFENEYTVIPVGSCEEVKRITKIINTKKSFYKNEAIGIIDYDFRPKEEIVELSEDKIYVTKYNEIEMLLCDEKVINNVCECLNEEKNKKIENFKNSFYKKIEERKEQISVNYIKKYINNILETHKIETNKIEKIKEELKRVLLDIDYEQMNIDILDNINSRINNNNYDEMLYLCNLKDEIVDELGNKLLKQYRIHALHEISTNSELKEYLKEKYFEMID